MIFVDSDAYIAVNAKDDPHHRKALFLSKELRRNKIATVTSWMVVDEVATKLSYFTTKGKSLDFLDNLLRSQTKIVYVGRKLTGSIVERFQLQTSKCVSLTDCTNMVIAKELGIDTFFSFDRHYKKNGFKLLEDVI